MNILIRSSAMAIAAMLLFAPSTLNSANAQTLPTTKPIESITNSPPKIVPPKAPISLGFKSTFDQYKSYGEEKPGGWRAANDEVGRIGGWRAYLKEANEPDSRPRHDPAPSPNPSPSPSTDPHAAHRRM
jgi:hypothetical protein